MREEQSIGRLISIINRRFSVYLNTRLKDPSIGIGQVRLLKFIQQHPGCCQRDISDHFKMDKGTTTTLIRNLEKNQLVLRVKSSTDSRQNNLNLTNSGEVLAKTTSAILKDWTQQLLKDFSEEETDQAYIILNRMVDNLSDLGENE